MHCIAVADRSMLLLCYYALYYYYTLNGMRYDGESNDGARTTASHTKQTPAERHEIICYYIVRHQQ